MKKIKSISKGRHFPSITIYKDDLQKILEILNEVCERVKISDEEYEYESLEELEHTKGLKPKQISITGISPYVSLDLKQNSIWLYRSDSDQKSVYIYKQIEEILLSKKNLISTLFNKSGGIISCVILFILFFMPVATLKDWFPNLLSRLSLLIIVILIPIISILARNGNFSLITLRKSHEEKNFFYRNKDDIAKIVIGAVVGSILTWILTRFAGN